MIDWNKFAKEVHAVAVDKGWWDKPVNFDDIICECLVHLGRAYEEHRSGRPNLYYPCNAGGVCEADKTEGAMDCASRIISPEHPEIYCTAKSKTPHGTAAELGECVLGLLDYLATVGVDIDSELGTIPAPENLTALVCECVENLAGKNTMGVSRSAGDSEIGRITRAIICIMLILDWARQNNMDLESICHELHECNKARAGRRERAEP